MNSDMNWKRGDLRSSLSSKSAHTDSGDWADSVISRVFARIPQTGAFDARQILGQFPELLDRHSLAVEVVFEEFCREAHADSDLTAQEFIARYPEYRDELQPLLQVHSTLNRPPEEAAHGQVFPDVGDEVGEFLLMHRLGRGAFSVAFLAAQRNMDDRQVVLKITSCARGEIAALSRLDHNNIVPVYNVGTIRDANLTAICMPYRGRVTMLDVMRYGKIEKRVPYYADVFETTFREKEIDLEAFESDAADKAAHQDEPIWRGEKTYHGAIVSAGEQLLRALEAAHRKGVYHCDIKPSNVLLNREGRAQLFDFNLSQSDDNGINGGTLPYMAPEQVMRAIDPYDDDASPISAQTDLFSWAVTMYHLLTGELPFGNGAGEGLTKHQQAQRMLARQQAGARPIRELNPHVSRRLASVIHRALDFDAAARPGDLQSLADEVAVDRRMIELRRQTIDGNPWWLAYPACLCVILIVAAALASKSWWMNRDYLSELETRDDFRLAISAQNKNDTDLGIQALGRLIAATPREERGSPDYISARLNEARLKWRAGRMLEAESGYVFVFQQAYPLGPQFFVEYGYYLMRCSLADVENRNGNMASILDRKVLKEDDPTLVRINRLFSLLYFENFRSADETINALDAENCSHSAFLHNKGFRQLRAVLSGDQTTIDTKVFEQSILAGYRLNDVHLDATAANYWECVNATDPDTKSTYFEETVASLKAVDPYLDQRLSDELSQLVARLKEGTATTEDGRLVLLLAVKAKRSDSNCLVAPHWYFSVPDDGNILRQLRIRYPDLSY